MAKQTTPAAEAHEKSADQAAAREQMLQALAPVKRIQLNSQREILFAIPRSPDEARTDFILSVRKGADLCVIGVDCPEFDKFPTQALAKMVNGLRSGSIKDVTHGEKPQIPRPLLKGIPRVPDGKDPVTFSGLKPEKIAKILLAPPELSDDAALAKVFDQIKSFDRDYPVLVGLKYWEECNRRRPAVLSHIEGLIQPLQADYAEKAREVAA